MSKLVFITGNQHKADFLAAWLGRPVEHRKIDLVELQSLDLSAVVQAKAEAAYLAVGGPVLVEDVALTFTAMGRLPGTFVRWFLEELGASGMAAMANRLPHNKAEATILYALYDGRSMHLFDGKTTGTIVREPRGAGWGWNDIFLPDGFDKTYGEMSDAELNEHGHRGQAIRKLQAYLQVADIQKSSL